MAAKIFGTRVLVRKEPAWHQLGTVIEADDMITPRQGLRRAGLTYHFEKQPLYFQDPETQELRPVPEVAVVRSPTRGDEQWRYISTVHKSYGLLQNEDLAELLEPLVERWPIETIGALGHGETTFMTLRAGTTDIKGEALDQYFLLTDNRQGIQAVHMGMTSIRVVCQNTLSMALRAKDSALIRLKHFASIKQDLTVLRDIMQQMEQQQLRVNRVFTELAEKTVTSDDVQQIIAAAYPLPTTRAKALLDQFGTPLLQQRVNDTDVLANAAVALQDDHYQQVLAMRRETNLLYVRLSDEYPHIGGTAWAAYNAVAEQSDKPRGRSTTITPKAAQAIVWGSRADERHRALHTAMALVGVN